MNSSVAPFLDDEEIREAVTIPRNFPRKIREAIAEILYREIMAGEDYDIRDAARFIDKFGAFYLLFISLKGSPDWLKLKSLASAGRISGLIVLRIVLTKIFDLLDDIDRFGGQVKESSIGHMELPLAALKALLEDTLELWHRRALRADTGMPMANGLTPRILRYQEDGPSMKFLNAVSRDIIMADIMGEAREIEGHLASLEMLSLLYPGRGWDRSMLELHRAYFENLDRYSKIVERNEDIKKILDRMGRIEMEYGAKRLSLASSSRSELYSVTTSDDVQHVLPVESVKLLDDTLRSLFFARWMEGKLLTYHLTGKNFADGARKRRGPMIALVDTSGSMHGAPEIVAKAVILALVRRMLRESRDVKVFLFSAAGQTTEIELTDRSKMATEFLDFLSYTFEGGTDFNTALRKGLETLRERRYGNADILFITDGLSAVSDETVIAGLEKVKKDNGTRLFTLIVGNDDAGGMDRFSDRVFILSRADRWDPDDGPANAIKLISAR